MEQVRVDRWLWGVRMFKTRSQASDACRGGKVKVNGTAAKPSTPLKVGDRVEATAPSGKRILEVTDLVEKRVGAPRAAECYLDHSPPPPPRERRPEPVFERERGSGRPTKRDRRRLDRLRER